MTEQKQIEEMAKSMCRNYGTQVCVSCDAHATCMIHLYAVDVYNAGYSKQIVGEWLPSPDGIIPIRCSQCNAPALCATGVGTFGDFEMARHPSNFCPNCGAHMKGGETDAREAD